MITMSRGWSAEGSRTTPWGQGEGRLVFYSYLPSPHPLRIFQNVFPATFSSRFFPKYRASCNGAFVRRRQIGRQIASAPRPERLPPWPHSAGARAVERMGGCSKLFPRNDGASTLPDVP
jgi:hypothetical protein